MRVLLLLVLVSCSHQMVGSSPLDTAELSKKDQNKFLLESKLVSLESQLNHAESMILGAKTTAISNEAAQIPGMTESAQAEVFLYEAQASSLENQILELRVKLESTTL